MEVTERIAAGEFTWAGDFKNLHPSPFGQALYHASMKRMLESVWPTQLNPDDKISSFELPAALDPFAYSKSGFRDLGKATVGKGFALVKAWKPVKGGTRAGFVNTPALVAETPGS